MIVGKALVPLAASVTIPIACHYFFTGMAVAGSITFKHLFIIKLREFIKILKNAIKLR
jgi:hypothetical protein